MNTLKKYNQKHLLKYYSELNKGEQKKLKEQIKKINFKKMHKLYINSYKPYKIDLKKISPLNVIKENNKYRNIGIEFVKSGRYAVVIMAGGNGSRLGFNGPKGCFELNIDGEFISLFEIYIRQLKKIIIDYNIVIPLYIMTSTLNYNETVNYFKQKNYFNYPKDKIKIFKQSNLPILGIDGKVLLKDKKNILFGPNGNGDVFKALLKNNLIKNMTINNIEYALFVNIDNILNNLVDFNFIGTTIQNNYSISSKTIKLNEIKEWIFCNYKKHPFMLPMELLNKKLFNYKENDNYVYRYKNISYHLINIKLIKKFAHKKLPYHRAYKKSFYLNSLNEKNSFKFEKFIFDAFYYSKDMLLYEVDNNSFYPIKRIDDIKKAIDLYKNNRYNNYKDGEFMSQELNRVVVEDELKEIFVKKDVDTSLDNVKAAIITAASKMALATNIITEDEVVEKLSSDISEEARTLIGMGPQYVKDLIGYSVDFNDYANSTAEYSVYQDKYDKLYEDIKSLNIEQEKQI